MKIDVKKYEEGLEGLNKLNKKIEQNINNGVTFSLWAEVGGKCPICGEELLEFTKGHDYTNNSQKAHIISRNESRFRPRIRCLYSPKLLKKLGFSEGKSLLLNNKKEINNKNNLILLCLEHHKYFDQKPETDDLDWHHKSSEEMLTLKVKEKPLPDFVKFRISKEESISETLNSVMVGYLEQKNIKNQRIHFDVIDELGKYNISENASDIKNIDYSQEEELLNNLNEWIYSYPDFQSALKNISSELKKYYKSISPENQPNIEHFLFNIKIKNNDCILEISTKKRSDNKIDGKKTKANLATEVDKILKEKDINIDSWILNSAKTMESMKKRKDFKRLEALLFKSLSDFSKNDQNFMDSFSIAYMARWGTGKTSLIRSLVEENKEYFRYVEINLWHIANTISDKTHKDNPFIRSIVKEALTQMAGNPDVVANYLDAVKYEKVSITEADLSKKVLDEAISLPSNVEAIDIIKQRNKFIDQYIHTLTTFINRLFSRTKKPIIFVFDDLDRVTNDEYIIKMLDALVAFLNIKNCIFIIPVDESKVVKALYKEKSGIEPSAFINKYFNYQIKAPFIPSLERMATLVDVLKTSGVTLTEIEKSIIVKLFNPNYRDVKDFVNNYKSNHSLFEDSIFYDDAKKANLLPKILSAGTIIQQWFPLLIDYLAENISNRSDLKQSIESIKLLDSIIKSGHTFMSGHPTKEQENTIQDWKKLNKPTVGYWSAILGIDLQENQLNNPYELLEIVNPHTKQKMRIQIKNIVSKLLSLESAIGLTSFSDDELLYLWGVITQAKIKTPAVKNFVTFSPVYKSLSNDEYDISKKIAEVSSSLSYYEFFDEVDDMVQKDVIYQENINSIFDNAIIFVDEIIKREEEGDGDE